MVNEAKAPTAANVFALFEHQALQWPDAPAVVDPARTASYGDLYRRADDVCRFLKSRGVLEGQAIGVLMQRRAELLCVLLGIWKAGAAYVPFDPKDPPDRLRRMLRSCGCSVLVGDPGLTEPLLNSCLAADPESAPLCFSADEIPNGQEVREISRVPEDGRALAYLLFTSGSTGDPKAVEVEHRNVSAVLQSARALLGFSKADRYLASSTIAFDASITELFLPLVTGACLIMRDRSIVLTPAQLAHDIRELGITIVQTGPSVWATILNEMPDFPKVRVAITHGEAVTASTALRLLAHADTVWNLYGPTETAVWATGHQITRESVSSLSPLSVPIGRPLPHVIATVMDGQGRPVPDGIEGELCLGGPSVARGYRNNPELTRDKFVTMTGERYYRSGDLVIRDAGGVLHYLGRTDDQMKIRGIRIEPREVEAAILRDQRVAQAAVTWYPTQSGTRAIVAAMVMRKGHSCETQDIYDGLVKILPKPMIPARYLFVPWLPMNANGKVDRSAIREAAQMETHAHPVPKVAQGERLSADERLIAEVWQRMLGVDAVSADDHFFSIGGDSLSAVQMIVEIESRFSVQLPIHLAFEAPTLRALAQRVDKSVNSKTLEADAGFVFPVAGDKNQPPLFFSGVDLLLARRGRWTVPCRLYAMRNWAEGIGFANTNSMEALAASHIARVRQIQPVGPYRLGGYSLGGLIAFEMAQQLKASGEAVDLLFLLDPLDPSHVDIAEQVIRNQPRPKPVNWLRSKVQSLIKGPPLPGWKGWVSFLLPVHKIKLVGWLHYKLASHHLRHPSMVSRLALPRSHWRAFWFAARRMVDKYRAKPYGGRSVSVFCEIDQRHDTWKALLGPQAAIHKISAEHHELFEEQALQKWMALLAQASTISGSDGPNQMRG